MPSTKVKVEKESKEERVAKVSLKQTVIATAITALLTVVAAISVAVINKPVNSNVEAEVHYFEAKAKITSDDFTEVRNDLEKAQAETAKQLAIEKNPKRLTNLKEAESAISRAIEENTKAQKSVEVNVERSLEAIKSGDRVAAAIYRKEANDALKQEMQIRQNASLVVEKTGLQITLRSDEAKPIREPKERSERWIRAVQERTGREIVREREMEGGRGVREIRGVQECDRGEVDRYRKDMKNSRGENVPVTRRDDKPDKDERYIEARERRSQ
jgi:hypothetical protein